MMRFLNQTAESVSITTPLTAPAPGKQTAASGTLENNKTKKVIVPNKIGSKEAVIVIKILFLNLLDKTTTSLSEINSSIVRLNLVAMSLITSISGNESPFSHFEIALNE